MKNLVIVGIVLTGVGFMQAASFKEQPISKPELGKLLFFDPILSRDSTISCSSCHIPAFAFADTATVSKGVFGRKGTRNSPTAMNLLLGKQFFWDGRAANLHQQALQPISNPDEMDLSLNEAVIRLQRSKQYRTHFQSVFNQLPDTNTLAEAIASFEKTLETSDSPFDDWKMNDNASAVNEAAKRGFTLFGTKGKCTQCHFGADFTQHEFRNIGLFDGNKLNDSGRAKVTGLPADIGKFKTPSLRNIALTAPYMHNGMLKKLEDVIEFYNDPSKVVPGNLYRDTILARPLGLTAQEKSDLKEFLLTLTDKRFKK